MKIAEHHITALQTFGYTETEARFLYIVATHSGYFVPRQFIAFSGAKWGKRSAHFADKIERHGHAGWREYQGAGGVYHLFAKKLYGQIGKENIRNRRKHSVEFIRTRLVLLDFILANLHHDYLETEQAKLDYFCSTLKIAVKHLPAKTYVGNSRTEPTLRYFIDKFPLFFDNRSASSSPVVTFSYIDAGEVTSTGLVNHLRAYQPLFRKLPQFRFLYIANSQAHFARAKELFSSLVAEPLGADISQEISRYFHLRRAWEQKQYGNLTNDDIEWLKDARKRFAAQRIDAAYRTWTLGKLGDLALCLEFADMNPQHKVAFSTYLIAENTQDRSWCRQEG